MNDHQINRVCNGLAGLSVLVGGLMSASAGAALVAYDPFLSGSNRAAGEYTPATDMRSMGAAALGWVGTQNIDGFGVPHAGSTSNFQANALGEDAAAVSYEAGGRLQWLGGPSVFDRNLTRQLNPTASSGEWWMSIMVNRLNWTTTTTPASTNWAAGGFTDGSNNGIQFGYDDADGTTTPDLIARVNGTNTVLEADTASSANYFLIAQLLVNTGGDDTINIWTDPGSLNLGTPDQVITTDLTNSLTPFTQSRYEAPGISGVTYFDEIRLATSFEALIPEPASMALVGLGGLSALRRRRHV